MDNNASGADGRVVSDIDRTDNHAVAADVDAIAYDRTIVRGLAHSDSGRVTERAVGADDCVVMDNQGIAVVKTKTRPDFGFVVQLDAQLPIHEKLVDSQIRHPGPPDPAWPPMQLLREAEGGEHQLTPDVARIGGPILQDALAHLTCGLPMGVYFYLPEAYLPSVENRALWRQGRYVMLEEGGKLAAAHSWIYRTWMALAETGCRSELVHQMPREGCVLALSGTIPASLRAHAGMFLVGVVADGLPHPTAHMHILQNPTHARRLPRGYFMPHWPQPGLIPREASRGMTLERIAFFGTKENLAAQLQDHPWRGKLQRETGVTLEIRGADRWHDYSDVDAVVAVRDFRGGRQLHKPATKLYNAWLAGVPFIGGVDSAYAAEGQSGIDYLLARSPDEVIAHLARLKRDESLRRELVENGKRKSLGRGQEAITALWRSLVQETIPALAAIRGRRPESLNFCADAAVRGTLALDRVFRS
ncbi:MAG: hypothetical protein RIQ71_18 [Verrucomicrobiota bacterium]